MPKHQAEIEYLQFALSRVQHMYAAVFAYEGHRGEELLLPKEISVEIDDELELLRKELESKQLPKVLIPCADFLADSIFLFQQAIKEAKIITGSIDESHITSKESLGFLAQHYKQKRREEHEYLVLKRAAFDGARDYYSKASELIKSPARKAGLSDLIT